MNKYRWKAIDRHGKNFSGKIEAESQAEASAELRHRGYLVTRIVPVGSRLAFLKRQKNKLSSGERSLFTRQLATMLKAGLPLENALKVIAEQAETPRLSQFVIAVRARVIEGHSLHESLSISQGSFSKLYCTLVLAGEKTGKLGEVLEKLADYLSSSQVTQQKLSQAMIYPVVLTLVALSVICILMSVVVPQVIEQFVHMKQTLPLSTRILIMMSDFIQHWGAILLIVLCGMIVGFKIWLRNDYNSLKFHRWLILYSPVKRLIKTINATRYLRTLSILLSSYVPLLDAMNVAKEANNNKFVNQLTSDASDDVRKGGELCLALEKTKIFPGIMLSMLASGERSGSLNELMNRAVDVQEKELQHRITFTVSIFEPALVISMAGVVLFIVLAILQPILQLNNLVR